jgi:CheY-like chemotaxis protein
VHSKKIGTVFSIGLIHRFFVISYIILRKRRKEVPRKKLNDQTERFLSSASCVTASPQRRPLRRVSELLEVGAHAPDIWDLRPPISVEISVNPSMKSRLAPLPLPRLARLALLYTRDDDLEKVVRQALWETGTILLIARTVEDALQIVCRRARELDVVIMAFNEGCHGITLLSAIHGCCEQLPTLVIADKDSEHARALAYANGARFCLSKPVSPPELANAIADLQPAAQQLAVA